MAEVSVFERVKRILSETGAKEEEIKPESHLEDDLNLDSLDRVELILDMEEEFAGELKRAGMSGIPDEDAEKMQTVQSIVDFIELHKREAG